MNPPYFSLKIRLLFTDFFRIQFRIRIRIRIRNVYFGSGSGFGSFRIRNTGRYGTYISNRYTRKWVLGGGGVVNRVSQSQTNRYNSPRQHLPLKKGNFQSSQARLKSCCVKGLCMFVYGCVYLCSGGKQCAAGGLACDSVRRHPRTVLRSAGIVQGTWYKIHGANESSPSCRRISYASRLLCCPSSAGLCK